jgi:hypothetical protein
VLYDPLLSQGNMPFQAHQFDAFEPDFEPVEKRKCIRGIKENISKSVFKQSAFSSADPEPLANETIFSVHGPASAIV